jgi:hypothetical protein
MLDRSMELVRGITRAVQKRQSPAFILLCPRFRLPFLGEQIMHMRFFNVLRGSMLEAFRS